MVTFKAYVFAVFLSLLVLCRLVFIFVVIPVSFSLFLYLICTAAVKPPIASSKRVAKRHIIGCPQKGKKGKRASLLPLFLTADVSAVSSFLSVCLTSYDVGYF
ncbi:hypothetical protein BsWGS_10521 [Bradybaena similaris]